MRCPQCGSEINTRPGGITNCNMPWKAGTLNCWMMNMETPRDPLLTERQKTHGSFLQNAVVSQNLKIQLRHYEGWNDLSLLHREALDAICLKLSRIMSGQSKFKDHWDDIAGYAKLASEACD